jgi:membrane protease YdiL (CAAX protease family)
MLPEMAEPPPPRHNGFPATPRERPSGSARATALLEVLLTSDYPTQVVTQFGLLAAFGLKVGPHGSLTIGFVVALSIVDTVLLVALILLFLHAHGERPRDVFLGGRPIAMEAIHGVPLTVAAMAIAVAVLGSVQYFAPRLHTVEHNPLQELIRSPRDASLFALVVVVAGGIREEVQRAFLLHRFEALLGGGGLGVLVTSAAFGAGHLALQGVDAAIATGLLGAFWGIVYLRRRSVVAPIVSHAGFDLLQIAQFLVVGR